MAEKLDRFRRMSGGPNPNKRMMVLEKAMEETLSDIETIESDIVDLQGNESIYCEVYAASHNFGISNSVVALGTLNFNSGEFTNSGSSQYRTTYSGDTKTFKLSLNFGFTGTNAGAVGTISIRKNGIAVVSKEIQITNTYRENFSLSNILVSLADTNYIDVDVVSTAGTVSMTKVYLSLEAI